MLLERDQRIRDPVHNLVKFSAGDKEDSLLWKLVETPALQRLRRIRQLGFSEFVYPGATHTRFSHSLGAMQMARRMLHVLERNQQLHPREGENESWRLATLCAALLHDVGHGPYSHVFEEVSGEFGIKESHEDYTKKIIESDPIREILSSVPGDIFQKTISFFTTEPGSTEYSRIISSQLDADRLDFLIRDRYFTGVHFGVIDLEWLFDNLTIAKLPSELGSHIEEFVFVVRDKGLSVIVDYLRTYSQLYSKVYFHKTTRSVQYMVKKILTDAFSNEKYCNKIPETDPLRQYFGAAPSPPLDTYLALDDTSIINIIKYFASNSSGELTILCKRFLDRDLFKCFEPPRRPKDEPPRQKISDFEKKLKDDELLFYEDLVPAKGYKQYEIIGEDFLNNLLVHSTSDNDHLPVASLDPSVSHFADKTIVRFYFLTDDERQSAAKIWESL